MYETKGGVLNFEYCFPTALLFIYKFATFIFIKNLKNQPKKIVEQVRVSNLTRYLIGLKTFQHFEQVCVLPCAFLFGMFFGSWCCLTPANVALQSEHILCYTTTAFAVFMQSNLKPRALNPTSSKLS